MKVEDVVETIAEEIRKPESGRMPKIKIEQHSLGGTLWFGAWLFTLGFLELTFWKGALALVFWPYFLGSALAAS